jgi:hypothetical protein
MGSDGIAPPLLNCPLDKSEWSASCLGRFTNYESALPPGHIGPRAGQDAVKERNVSASAGDSSVVQLVH